MYIHTGICYFGGENMSETKLIVDEEFRSVDEETRKAGLFFRLRAIAEGDRADTLTGKAEDEALSTEGRKCGRP